MKKRNSTQFSVAVIGIIVLLVVSLFSINCSQQDNTPQPTPTSSQLLESPLTTKIQTPKIDKTKIPDRYLYVVSSETGQVLFSSEFNVEANNKHFDLETRNGYGWRYCEGIGYIEWIDTNGINHIQYINGGQFIHISTQPLKLRYEHNETNNAFLSVDK